MEERSVDAVVIHKGREDLIVHRITIAGAATKMLGIGTTAILSYRIPLTLPLTAESDGSSVLSTVSMEGELIEAHRTPR